VQKITPANPEIAGGTDGNNAEFAAVIAAAWQDTSRIKAAAELTPDERVKPLPVELEEVEKTATGLQSISDLLSMNLCQKIASIIHAAGAEQIARVESAEVLPISPVWDALFVPLNTDSVPTFGTDSNDVAPGNAWWYTWARGTTQESATLILREQIIRPTVGGDSMAEHPGYGFYGQGTLGDLNHHNVKIVVNKVTKLAKGTQTSGIILVGETSSKVQHHKINYASVSEEQRMVSCCGVVATHDRWAIHSKHGRIRAIIALLPARAPKATNS
jgi:hypothetical protein